MYIGIRLDTIFIGENCAVENLVRLDTADGYFTNGSGAGRVEICYCTGNGTCSWSTINAAGSTWSWPNTLVACRELGYSTGRNPIIGSLWVIWSLCFSHTPLSYIVHPNLIVVHPTPYIPTISTVTVQKVGYHSAYRNWLIQTHSLTTWMSI